MGVRLWIDEGKSGKVTQEEWKDRYEEKTKEGSDEGLHLAKLRRSVLRPYMTGVGYRER